MKKKINYCLYSISICIILLFLSGCSHQDTKDPFANEIPRESIPVADFTVLPFGIQDTVWLYASQTDLFYQEAEWSKAEKVMVNRIYQWNMEKSDSDLLFESSNSDDIIYCVFTDDAGNLYLYGSLSEKSMIHYYIKKISTDSSLEWQAVMDYDTMGPVEGQYIQGGVVGKDGQICLYDRYGKLYLFTAQGKLNNKMELPSATVDGMVRIQSGSLFAYFFESSQNRMSESLSFFCVNPETGQSGNKMTFTIESLFDVKNIWSGPENSIYAIWDNFLYEIDLVTQKKTKILSFDEEYVNIEGSQIQTVTALKDGRVAACLYDGLDKLSELSVISLHDTDDVAEKQTITIGTSIDDISARRLEYYIRRFNRQSKLWNVKMVDYFSDEYANGSIMEKLSLDILNGNGPDIIDTFLIPSELLGKKELFEDLEPYFEASKAVNQEDLLESVWRAGVRHDGMYFVMPWFMLQTSVVKKDILGESMWNLETLIKLSDEYPHSEMLNYFDGYKRLSLLNYALTANSDMFYNIENKTCSFMDSQFLSLLEGIKRIQDNGNVDTIRNSNEEIKKFQEEKLLVCQIMLDNMTKYQQLNKIFQDSVSWAGYPSTQECYNKFYYHVMLSISSSSKHKDGAWEFIEYLLSADSQKWTDQEFFAYPVRKDSFEYYIKASPLVTENGSEEYATDEECNHLYYMVENAYMVPFESFGRINAIVTEESMDYFYGDKSVEEAAQVIQNRVKLYLEEK